MAYAGAVEDESQFPAFSFSEYGHDRLQGNQCSRNVVDRGCVRVDRQYEWRCGCGRIVDLPLCAAEECAGGPLFDGHEAIQLRQLLPAYDLARQADQE